MRLQSPTPARSLSLALISFSIGGSVRAQEPSPLDAITSVSHICSYLRADLTSYTFTQREQFWNAARGVVTKLAETDAANSCGIHSLGELLSEGVDQLTRVKEQAPPVREAQALELIELYFATRAQRGRTYDLTVAHGLALKLLEGGCAPHLSLPTKAHLILKVGHLFAPLCDVSRAQRLELSRKLVEVLEHMSDSLRGTPNELALIDGAQGVCFVLGTAALRGAKRELAPYERALWNRALEYVTLHVGGTGDTYEAAECFINAGLTIQPNREATIRTLMAQPRSHAAVSLALRILVRSDVSALCECSVNTLRTNIPHCNDRGILETTQATLQRLNPQERRITVEQRAELLALVGRQSQR